MKKPVVNWSRVISEMEAKGYSLKVLADFLFTSHSTLYLLKQRAGCDPFYPAGLRVLDLHARLVKGLEQKTSPRDTLQMMKELRSLGLPACYISNAIGISHAGYRSFIAGNLCLRHGPATRLIALHNHMIDGWKEVVAGMTQEAIHGWA